ncbi:MAG: biopolymer transporter ExbD [Chitinophagales bacterium]|nr:biopolymer transporter ExbD [Chitinophagales bacterium]
MIERKSDIFNAEVTARDHRQKKDVVDIDMNPMVDLAFLLLTFFMLTTTFNQPQAMEIVMPVQPDKEAVEKEQPIKESRTLSIMLAGEDKIHWFRGITDPEVKTTSYSGEGIRKVLLEMDRDITDMVVLIKPTDDSNYKNLVDILDEMQITSIERYAIVKVSKSDRELIANL